MYLPFTISLPSIAPLSYNKGARSILAIYNFPNRLAAFLSYLRLSIYMSVVSIAIVISFHLKSKPTPLELRMALPLGVIFWILSIVCLALGLGNYIKTVTKYSRRMALVQTGWKTQVVCIYSYHISLLRLCANTRLSVAVDALISLL
jgi:Domain of unknown function (DUF202)